MLRASEPGSFEASARVRRWLESGAATLDAAEVARIARFAGNGLFNTALSYALFVVMLKMGMPVFDALLSSAGITTVFNFHISRLLVFRSKQKGLLLRFMSVYSVMLLVNYAVLLALQACGMPIWLAQAAVVLPIAALAYAAQRSLVFGPDARCEPVTLPDHHTYEGGNGH